MHLTILGYSIGATEIHVLLEC